MARLEDFLMQPSSLPFTIAVVAPEPARGRSFLGGVQRFFQPFFGPVQGASGGAQRIVLAGDLTEDAVERCQEALGQVAKRGGHWVVDATGARLIPEGVTLWIDSV